jgi:formate--tetrahydrofolate ligase
MLTDHEIASQCRPEPILSAARKLGLAPGDILPIGHDKAKISLEVLEQPRKREGASRLILVTAISPTKAGEGKTTTSIGLGQGLAKIGKSVCIALREPSLGPCMGVKGGATGGGYSQVLPAASINLHFTGDFHAITSAHNLLAAAIDNHLHHGNKLRINPSRVLWPRVIDMNDRALRDITIGLGSKNGMVRQTGFDITAASEVMAVFCLSKDLADLRARLERIVVAYDVEGQTVCAGQLKVTGAMMAMLKDAMLPNLVQTLEGTPTLIHGGPFANIAHGCNSVLATRMAMHLADWTVTEAGFGCDLGAEKFFDIKCVSAGLDVCAVVIVASIRALKLHGGVLPRDLKTPNAEAVKAGLANLDKHLDTIGHFSKHPVVAINRFHLDSEEELQVVQDHCDAQGVDCVLSEHFAKGGEGAVELAKRVVSVAEDASKQSPLTPLYGPDMTVREKIEAVARKAYGAKGVVLAPPARRALKRIRDLGYAHLPICVAKTQNSLSDNPRLKGRPENFEITVRNVVLNAGSGFLVVLTGDIMRMPGLPVRSAAEDIDIVDGEIVGIG